MSEVLESAEVEIRNLQDLVKQSHLCFIKTLRYFRHALPKKGMYQIRRPLGLVFVIYHWWLGELLLLYI